MFFSYCNVYAAESGTQESSEGVGDLYNDSNYYGTIADVKNGSIAPAHDMGDLLYMYNDFIWSNIADFSVLSSEYIEDCFQFVSDQVNTISDLWSHVSIFTDGKNTGYKVDAEFQQAVYDALCSYTATMVNAEYYVPGYTVQQAYDHRYNFESSKGFDHAGSDYIKSSSIGLLQINNFGFGYQQVVYTTYDFLVNAGSSDFGKKISVYSHTNSFNICSIVNGACNNFKTINNDYINLYDQQYFRIYGKPAFVFNTVGDAVNYIEGRAKIFSKNDHQPETIYITNDGLNYDWAASISNNYDRLVQGITEGTISGLSGINSSISDMAAELAYIRDTIDQTQEDVSSIEGLIKKYLPYLETINTLLSEYLPLLDDIANAPAAVIDLSSHLEVLRDIEDHLQKIFPLIESISNAPGVLEDMSSHLDLLKDIKNSVNAILGLMFFEDVTEVIQDFFDDPDEKKGYVEKSIGFILLVLTLFVYMIRIFVHLLVFIVAFFNIEPALCSDFLPDEVYQGFTYLDQIIIPYFNVSVWDFLQLLLFTTMIFFLIRVFISRMDHFKFND